MSLDPSKLSHFFIFGRVDYLAIATFISTLGIYTIATAYNSRVMFTEVTVVGRVACPGGDGNPTRLQHGRGMSDRFPRPH